jgi:hypothetical protein
MSDMTSAYFDDVVVDESHNALFTNVELDEIIGKANQTKFTNAELDDIIDKANQKDDDLAGYLIVSQCTYIIITSAFPDWHDFGFTWRCK